MSAPIPLEEAQARLLELATPLRAERVAAEAALGRCLEDDLKARRTQPPADLSAMDGYAVQGSGTWDIVGESAAGHPFQGRLEDGQAIRISTGALMPDGADAVLLQENATRDGNRLSLNGEGEPTARHIRRAGFDFRDGDKILAKGTEIGPAQLALAIAAGNGSLLVHAKPDLAILDSGDELARDPERCEAFQIPASNGAMLAAMAAPLARNIDLLGPVPDRMDAVMDAFERAANANVIVTSGGASVGDHDLIRPALERWGAEIGFWRVAMKPGKPLLVATKGKQIILGLPGNPVSSFVTGFLFLLPLLRALSGATNPLPRPLPLPLDGQLPEGGSRLEFYRAVISQGKVTPISERDSSALRALASANALILRPPHCGASGAGQLVPTYLL